MRSQINELNGSSFDVAVIGAGVNGSSAAHHLAAAGYSVLLVDKGDFSSGSSSRSSRLLHCGIRYLAPGDSLWEFVRHPDRFLVACRMARQSMESRSQFVNATPERVKPFTFFYPVFKEMTYRPWQIDLGYWFLGKLGPKDVPLDYGRLSIDEARRTPLLSWLDFTRVRGVSQFREYAFEWPERIVVDTVLDAERMGAVVRNYTTAVGLERSGEAWRIRLADTTLADDEAVIEAKVVLNMAGIWIDQVNALAREDAPRKITGTKGTHIVVQLPPECAQFGIGTMNKQNEPFYCIPWRGLHYFGPSETLYEGNLEDIRMNEDEIAWLLDEANHLLPGAGLGRGDVISHWAGVRPLTYDPAQPMGARDRELHDLSADGLPNVLTTTAGPIMTHRSAGQEACAAVQRRIGPSGEPRTISFAAREFLDTPDSPPLDNRHPKITVAALRHMAEHERPVNLIDLVFRRAGYGWDDTMGLGVVQRAAEAVADIMDWDAETISREVAGYRTYIAHTYGLDPSADSAVVRHDDESSP